MLELVKQYRRQDKGGCLLMEFEERIIKVG